MTIQKNLKQDKLWECLQYHNNNPRQQRHFVESVFNGYLFYRLHRD